MCVFNTLALITYKEDMTNDNNLSHFIALTKLYKMIDEDSNIEVPEKDPVMSCDETTNPEAPTKAKGDSEENEDDIEDAGTTKDDSEDDDEDEEDDEEEDEEDSEEEESDSCKCK